MHMGGMTIRFFKVTPRIVNGSKSLGTAVGDEAAESAEGSSILAGAEMAVEVEGSISLRVPGLAWYWPFQGSTSGIESRRRRWKNTRVSLRGDEWGADGERKGRIGRVKDWSLWCQHTGGFSIVNTSLSRRRHG